MRERIVGLFRRIEAKILEKVSAGGRLRADNFAKSGAAASNPAAVPPPILPPAGVPTYSAIDIPNGAAAWPYDPVGIRSPSDRARIGTEGQGQLEREKRLQWEKINALQAGEGRGLGGGGPDYGGGGRTELLLPMGTHAGARTGLGQARAGRPPSGAPGGRISPAVPAPETPRRAEEGGLRATDAAARTASERGIDLASVRGTGVGGKITKEDVERTHGERKKRAQAESRRRGREAEEARLAEKHREEIEKRRTEKSDEELMAEFKERTKKRVEQLGIKPEPPARPRQEEEDPASRPGYAAAASAIREEELPAGSRGDRKGVPARTTEVPEKKKPENGKKKTRRKRYRIN